MKNLPKSQILQKKKKNLQILCQKPLHQENPIRYVCTASSCDEDLLCESCLNENHHLNHKNKVHSVEDILFMELDKNPIKRIKIDSTVTEPGHMKDILSKKGFLIKKYSQALKEEFQNLKEQISQFGFTFERFQSSLVKKLENSYTKALKDLKLQFNIFEYSTFRIPSIKKEVENICLNDLHEYRSVITSIVELEKVQNDQSIPDFLRSLGESFSLDQFCNLIMKTIEKRPVLSENTELINMLEHQFEALQKNILGTSLQEEKNLSKEKIISERLDSNPRTKAFDFNNAALSKTLISQNRITALTVSDPKKIVVGSESGMLEYWNIENQMIIQKTLAHNGLIKSLISVNNKTIVSGSRDNFIKVFCLPNLQCIMKVDAHSQGVNALTNLDGSNIIVSGGMDNYWKVWNIQSGKIQSSKPASGISCIQTLDSSVRDKVLWEKKLSMTESTKKNLYVVAIGGKKEIYLWMIDSSGERDPYPISTLKGHKKEIRTITSVEGTILASAGNDYTIRLWDLKTGSCQRVINNAHENFITNIGFIETNVFVSSGLDGMIKFWDTKGLELKSWNQHKGFIYCLGFDREGGMITAGDDRLIRIWR